MKRRDFLQLTGAAGTAIFLSPVSFLQSCRPQELNRLDTVFMNPDKVFSPWVVWHWTGSNATKEGVTASIDGMAESGISGATLFSFPPGNGTVLDDPAEPLSPEWWELVIHSIQEADRAGIKMAMQVCVNWATAGGPFITPELSQQQLVWRELTIEGGQPFEGAIARPDSPEFEIEEDEEIPQSWLDYYNDLGVLAVPVSEEWERTSVTENAQMTTNLPGTDLQRITDPENQEQVIDTEQAGWIQFAFDEPFTLRSIALNHGSGGGLNLHYWGAQNMEVQASDDGVDFETIGYLEPMLNGWQTNINTLTHTVPQTTARYFRLVYEPETPLAYDECMQTGTSIAENFDEILVPLGVASIVLSSRPVVHHLPGKNATTWGRSRRITREEQPDSACVPLDDIIDLTDRLQPDGSISGWTPPEGRWKLMRFGYTTQGETNGSGPGTGLEADKFSSEAARVQFEGWYGETLRRIGSRLSSEVLTMLNIDSWECGSQNWSPVFRKEFQSRRGYDVLKYLPAMTGIPVENADVTERFLYDVRRTCSDLICENFYGTLQELAHENGSLIQTEVIAPTMNGDGMEIFKNVDVSAGEFWAGTWFCWKPCDIKEAVSSANVYGKQIAMAEAFTGGGDWGLHPFEIKALGDHNFVEGINRFMLHLWAAQPYPGRAPGIPGAAGTYFNEHQTWMPHPGSAYIEYLRRIQSVLQQGQMVSDALYFTGEDLPSRALLPPEYGSYFVADPPLPDGYKFDSINRDALLTHASVDNDGAIVLNSGARYRVLVLRPDGLLSSEVAALVRDLVQQGATVVGPKPTGPPGNEGSGSGEEELFRIADEVWGEVDGETVTENQYGEGRVVWGRSMETVLSDVEIAPDVKIHTLIETATGDPVEANAFEPTGDNPTLYGAERRGWGVEWNHSTVKDQDIYFVSNQEYFAVTAEVSFRTAGRVPELWHPDTGEIEDAPVWREENGRTHVTLEFPSSGSVFVVFRREASETDQVVQQVRGDNPDLIKLHQTPEKLTAWLSEPGSWILQTQSGQMLQVTVDDVPAPVTLEGPWTVDFPSNLGPPGQIELDELISLTEHPDDGVRYFSGTASYHNQFSLTASQLGDEQRLMIDLGDVADIAEVRINGKQAGIVWKPPYILEITDFAIAGSNQLEINLTNTWRNRLIGDQQLPEQERITWLVSSGFGGSDIEADTPLVEAGLLGPVRLVTEVKAIPRTG